MKIFNFESFICSEIIFTFLLFLIHFVKLPKQVGSFNVLDEFIWLTVCFFCLFF